MGDLRGESGEKRDSSASIYHFGSVMGVGGQNSLPVTEMAPINRVNPPRNLSAEENRESGLKSDT